MVVYLHFSSSARALVAANLRPFLGVFWVPPFLCFAWIHTSFSVASRMKSHTRAPRQQLVNLKGSLPHIWPWLFFFCQSGKSFFKATCNTMWKSNLDGGSPCLVLLLISNMSLSLSVRTVVFFGLSTVSSRDWCNLESNAFMKSIVASHILTPLLLSGPAFGTNDGTLPNPLVVNDQAWDKVYCTGWSDIFFAPFFVDNFHPYSTPCFGNTAFLL